MKNWAIYILAAMGFVAYDWVTEADRDSTGAIIGEGSVDAFEVKIGDCFDDSNSFDEITSVPGVPCAEPHDNEAYALIELTLNSYPAGDAMSDMATDVCIEQSRRGSAWPERTRRAGPLALGCDGFQSVLARGQNRFSVLHQQVEQDRRRRAA